MTARIVLLGATGYTGRRTATALVARGMRPVLAGRDPERVATLAAELGALETAHADVTDPASLERLLRQDDVVVSTVGPFQTLGRGVIETAIDVGAIYLDSTGEAGFIRSVFERYGALATRSGARLLTAFGCDWVPGNLAGAVLLDALRDAPRPVTQLQIGYFVTGADRTSLSRGTVASMLGVGLQRSYRFHRRHLSPDRVAARRRAFSVDDRMPQAVSVGGTEQFTLPRLSEHLGEVDVYLGWLGGASAAVQAASPLVDALGRVPGAAATLARLGTRVASRLPDGPAPDAASAVRSQTIAEAFDRYGTLLGRVRVDGPEPYGMTADLLAWGAARAATEGVTGTGALGPVDAFGLDALRDGARSAGLEVVEEA